MPANTEIIWADRAAKAVLLIRILVGWVFLSEGIQKFLFPDSLGVGRFLKIGIPSPQVMAPFVGVVEIVCGSLLLIGLVTRLATVPLLIDIFVALYSQTEAANKMLFRMLTSHSGTMVKRRIKTEMR